MRPHCAQAGDDEEGLPGDQVEDEALEDAEEEAGDAEGDVPCDDLERGGGHDVLEVEGSVDGEDAPGAVEEEESEEEGRHGGGGEYRGGKKGVWADVRFYVDCREEEKEAEGKAYGDVWCLPSRGSVRGLSDGEDGKGEAGDDGEGAKVVHFDAAWRRFLRPRVWD